MGFSVSNNKNQPDTVDQREKGFDTDVKNQVSKGFHSSSVIKTCGGGAHNASEAITRAHCAEEGEGVGVSPPKLL